ncbi:MAG: RNA recognition motif domain-containing protein [Gammaproteobacteria bacterium]
MGRKLYVGNLSFTTTEETLRSKFAELGVVDSVNLISNRDTGESRGFGFVEMGTDAEASKAIAELNGAELDGRALKVNEAKPQEKRSNSDRGGFGGRGRW